MANKLFPFTPELKTFQATDDAWGAELVRLFGKNACNIRYLPQGKGEQGTELRRLHDARDAARIAWHRSAY